MRRSMDWTVKDRRLMVCSYEPHSQAAEGAMPHLCEKEWKRLTSKRRWLSRIRAVLSGSFQEGGCRRRNWKDGVSQCSPTTLHIQLVICPERCTSFVFFRWTDELLCGEYKWVSRFEMGCLTTHWTVKRCVEEMSRLHGTACWRQYSSFAMKLSGVDAREDDAGVGRKYPFHVTEVSKASLMTALMRPVWGLRHQAGAQYPAVEWIGANVAVRSVLASSPQTEPAPARCLRGVTRDVSFLRSYSRCRGYLDVLFNVTPKNLGSEQKGRVWSLKFNFSSGLASLLRWKTADAVLWRWASDSKSGGVCL